MTAEDAMTLSQLLIDLSAHFSELAVLDKIFTGGVVAHRLETSVSEKAAGLLTEIFCTRTDLNSLGDDSDALVHDFTSIFLLFCGAFWICE